MNMATVEQLVTDNLDLWTTAIRRKSTAGRGSSSKGELYGIKKLRELVLELAVRGLLVPQDPSDEPASEQLKKIAAERAKLVKEGKIKKDRPLPAIEEDEKSFELPKGWEWCRLGMIGEIFNGNSISASVKEERYTNVEGLPFIATKDVGYGFEPLDYQNGVFIPFGESGFKIAKKDAVLICAEGGSAGKKCGITNQDICFGNKLFANEPYGDINPRFILSSYLTPTFFTQFSSSMTGIIGGVSSAKFSELLVPIAPIQEQQRIVAKVDALMALCDQLEQQTAASFRAHQILVETLLNMLTSATDHAQSSSAWQRIAEHFDALFTTEKSVSQLEQTFLQLAVMGKLVPQDPNDEPANELLKKIATEKAELAKEGKIKKYLSVEPMGKSQALPATWVEIVVQDFADIRLGSTPSRADPKFWNGHIPWVSSGEVADCVIRDTYEKITHEGFKNSSTSMIPARSLLMAIIGQGKTRGQTALLEIEACTNQNVAAFVFNEQFVCPEYVWIWAKSRYESHRDDGHGGAQPALNGKKVRSFRFPLAPIAEQRRIVAKVHELMALCDQLKSCLEDAQTTQLHLADALSEKALAGTR